MSDRWRIVVRRPGGPEVLEREAIGTLVPAAGELLIRHEAIGLNFAETYYRTGLYPVALPSSLGNEAAGTVEAVGADVEGFREGDRVGYFLGHNGAYATHRLISARKLVPLPSGIDPETAAAVMIKGCTAEFLIERCARIEAGQTVLVHAAAGGVGSILVSWLKSRGAIVIAHAGSAEKARRAKALGADHALSCAMDDLAAQVRALTGGKGVAVSLDGVGAASWNASLASVGQRGLLVTYGNASGPVPPFKVSDLRAAGSIFVTRPALPDYLADEGEMRASAARLFAMVTSGTIEVTIGARYALSDVAEAHRALEARKTVGSTLLIP
ncbi:MAG TPA: quinone oxidoreductase [Allosphingosinicella sp.]|nr:quinone oxidoreductase [Allosphingosinicella sp.]